MLKIRSPGSRTKVCGNHRIVGVGVFLDVEVLLHRSLGVTEKRPQRAEGIAELVQVERGVRADDDEPRVGNPELRIPVRQIPEKAMLLRVVGPSGQVEDHRVPTLELRELPQDPSLVLQLVVRKRRADDDVFAHASALLASKSTCAHSSLHPSPRAPEASWPGNRLTRQLRRERRRASCCLARRGSPAGVPGHDDGHPVRVAADHGGPVALQSRRLTKSFRDVQVAGDLLQAARRIRLPRRRRADRYGVLLRGDCARTPAGR